MKRFSVWLEEDDENENENIPEIQGEYWINDGSVQYADGDVGDYNHEALAIQHVSYKYFNKLRQLSRELGMEEKKNWYGGSEFDDENPDVEAVLERIQSHLEEKNHPDPDGYIQKEIGADNEAYAILQGHGNAYDYVIINEGWIAVRKHNVDLYDYAAQRSSLASGLGEILEQEAGWEEFDPSKVEFTITDHKTGKRIDATLADIENVQPVARPQLSFAPQPVSKGGVAADRRFKKILPDTGENIPQKKPFEPGTIKPVTYDSEAKKKGIIGPGQQLWRGTSEAFSFKDWLAKSH